MSLALEYSNAGYTDSIATRQNLIRTARQDLARNGETTLHHIERIEATAAGFIAHLVPSIPDTRPNAQVVTVPRSISLTEANLNRFADTLRAKGRTAVDVDFIVHKIATAEVSPAAREVRDRLAYTLVVKPYDIDVTATWDPDIGIDAIYIKRLPTLKDKDVTRAKLLTALPQVGGSIYWDVEIAPIHAAAKLTYKPKDCLPKMVSLDDVLPKRVDPTRWKKELLGVDPKHEPFYQDLTGTPHVLSQGPTGSGKTVTLTALCAILLMNGADIVIGDAIRGGCDFKGFQPLCLGWADSLEAVADAVQQAYEEGQRRKAVLLKIGKVKVADCSSEEVEKYKLTPLVVLLDEFGSLVIPLDMPKGADKEDPLVQEAIAQNNAKNSIKLYCGKIARELRFVSVFLIIATQVAQVAVVSSGEFQQLHGAADSWPASQLLPLLALLDQRALQAASGHAAPSGLPDVRRPEPG